MMPENVAALAAETAHHKKHAVGIERLAVARWRIAAVLTAGVLLSYYGFIFLVAFQKDTMGTELVPGLSIGIALGASVIAIAWVLTVIYVKWANGKYDRELAVIRSSGRGA